jgi:hypothetical protein
MPFYIENRTRLILRYRGLFGYSIGTLDAGFISTGPIKPCFHRSAPRIPNQAVFSAFLCFSSFFNHLPDRKMAAHPCAAGISAICRDSLDRQAYRIRFNIVRHTGDQPGQYRSGPEYERLYLET